MSDIKIPRNVHTALNEAIARLLKEYVSENNFEEGCCYFVKNIIPAQQVCFVHRFTKAEKSFQNIELEKLPDNIKKGDVVILKEGQFIVDYEITNEVSNVQNRAIESLKNSIELFRVEGKEYFVCDKSDDAEDPKMSLRIEETGEEFWAIEISKELYENIKYGSRVTYKNGKYVENNN